MTEKRFKLIIDDMERYYYWKDGTWEQINDESTANNFYTLEQCANELNRLNKENEQLKQTMKEVAELLSEEVDLFSDKATEHDIYAYVELKELDNKDAYYMAISTKKAIKMLKGDDVND